LILLDRNAMLLALSHASQKCSALGTPLRNM